MGGEGIQVAEPLPVDGPGGGCRVLDVGEVQAGALGQGCEDCVTATGSKVEGVCQSVKDRFDLADDNGIKQRGQWFGVGGYGRPAGYDQWIMLVTVGC
jgi:hypothetical protein